MTDTWPNAAKAGEDEVLMKVSNCVEAEVDRAYGVIIVYVYRFLNLLIRGDKVVPRRLLCSCLSKDGQYR